MIEETLSRKKRPALTSDHWHVLHAHWSGETSGKARFEREIVAERDDRASASDAAREIVAALAEEMRARPRAQRDQILVRRPAFKSLKTAGRVEKRSK